MSHSPIPDLRRALLVDLESGPVIRNPERELHPLSWFALLVDRASYVNTPIRARERRGWSRDFVARSPGIHLRNSMVETGLQSLQTSPSPGRPVRWVGS